MSNLTDELMKLAELRERGILTDAEFDAQKAYLLQGHAPQASAPPPPPPPPSPPPPPPPPAAPPTEPAVLSASETFAPSELGSPQAPPATPAPAHPQLAGPPDDQVTRAFIGANADYYLAKWRTADAQNKAHSWNWAAFLLSIYWMTYRKMFQPALMAAGAMMLLVVAGMLAPAINLLANALVVGIAAAVGWRGNTLYRDHVRRGVAAIDAANSDPQARLAAAQTRGGVSMPAALGLLAVWLIVVVGLAYVQYVRAQRMLATIAAAPTFPQSTDAGTTAPGANPPTTAPSAYASSGAGQNYPSANAAPAGGEWIIGQWGPVGSTGCSSWMRISPDHTMSDNAGNTGTWALIPGSGRPDTFVMTRPGQGSTGGPVERGPGNTMVMGTAPRTVTWQQVQC